MAGIHPHPSLDYVYDACHELGDQPIWHANIANPDPRQKFTKMYCMPYEPDARPIWHAIIPNYKGQSVPVQLPSDELKRHEARMKVVSFPCRNETENEA